MLRTHKSRTLGIVLAMALSACSSTSTSTNTASTKPALTQEAPSPPPAPPPPIAPDPPAVAPEPSPPSASAQPSAPPAEVPPPNWQPIPKKRPKGFPGVEFAEVKGFALDLYVDRPPECELPLDGDGTLCKTVEAPGVVLTAAQTKKLIALLKQPATFGGGSKCYMPHHAFVFYDKEGTPVAEIAVCFLCNMMMAKPSIPAAKGDTEYSFGVTSKGNEAFRALCNELGLPKCNADHPDKFGSGWR